MTPRQVIATNEAVLKALGIQQPLICALQIHMEPGQLPLVTIERHLEANAMQTTVQDFDLVLREEAAPAPTPALDLDAMCAAAQDRLAKATHLSAEWARQYQHEESVAIHARMDRALRQHKEAAAAALRQLDLVGFLGFDLEAAKVEAYQKALNAHLKKNPLSLMRHFNAASYTYARDCQ